MEITAAFKFRKLNNDEKVSLGDFLSEDNGKTLLSVTDNQHLGLYAGEAYYIAHNASFWRIVSQEW